MKEMKKEQISVLTAPYLQHTLEYAFDSIAANGYEKVELGVFHHITVSMTIVLCRSVSFA